MSPIAPTLQAFFTDRLTKQRPVSPRTVASYRDSLKLLLGFAQSRTGKAPTRLDWADLATAALSLRSSITSNTIGTTARAPATCS